MALRPGPDAENLIDPEGAVMTARLACPHGLDPFAGVDPCSTCEGTRALPCAVPPLMAT